MELNCLDKFPIFETDRLLLRELKIEDAPEILRLRSEDKMLTFIERFKLNTLEDAKAMIRMNQNKFKQKVGLIWGIELKETKKLIGYTGYHTFWPENNRAEICYLVLPEQWNKGYIQEAIDSYLPFTFHELKLHSIIADINPNNKSSIRVVERVGFRKEAHFKENIFFNGSYSDSAIYTLFEESIP